MLDDRFEAELYKSEYMLGADVRCRRRCSKDPEAHMPIMPGFQIGKMQ